MKLRILALSLIASLTLLTALSLSCGNADNQVDNYGPPQVTFPVDEGAHPAASVEWWYLNATLHDSDGGEYTAMAAYFRPTLRILSVADLNTGTFYQDVPTIWELTHTTPDYAEDELDLRWNETDRWYRVTLDPPVYHLKATAGEIGLDLELTSEKAPLTVGGDGLIEWTEGSTYYYSLTRLAINGQIEFAEETVDVEGIGWMDHQWMDEMSSEKGWDWFSIQLDDNTDIICWQIVNTDGSIDSRDLTMMFPDGSIYHTTDLELERLDSWTSSDTEIDYGTRWRLREERHDINLEISARFSQQEIILFADQPGISWQFWEGGATVSGRLDGETVSGIGYAELVPKMGP